MRFPRPKWHIVDLLFTLALFGVFAVSSLAVTVLGADVYKQTVGASDRNFDVRTSLLYISEKVRQNDTAGAVTLGELGQKTALVLEQTVGGETYQTWIYCYDGSLRELFVKKGTAFSPEDGQPLTELADFTASRAGDGLYAIAVMDNDGRMADLYISPRCA
jgi:hypothetical protein